MRALLCILLAAFGTLARADTLGNYTAHEVRPDRVVVHAGTAAVEVQPYAEGIVRVALLPFGTWQGDSSLVVVLPAQDVAWQVTEADSYLSVQMPGLDIEIWKYPLRLRFLRNIRVLLADEAGLFWNGAERGVRFRLENEHLYGAGERAVGLDLRGRRLNSYNNPWFCYGYGAENLNITIPYLLSSGGWSVYFDNPWPGYFDLGAAEANVLEYGTTGGELAYFIVAGEDYGEHLVRYTQLTGRQPLPPRWALGYLQSRYGYESEGEARGIVAAFRERRIPLDAIILDLYWFGWGQMGDLNWDYSRWPNPVRMLQDFDTAGVQTVLITEPYILTTSSNFEHTVSNGYLTPDSNGQAVIVDNFWAGAAGLLDITNPEAAEWFWGKYHALAAQGVEGWWTDLGEPEVHPAQMVHRGGPAAKVHNMYSLLWAKLLYEKYRQHFPQQRLFNLIRSGYAGMQRYSTFPWSGDVQRDWPGLRAQIPIVLQMGMSGVGYMLSDIGGFSCGPQNAELYTRWMQFGAFSPGMRAHGWQAATEPIFYDSLTEAIVTDYIELRYQLLPYNYSLAWENHRTGRPLARPLIFEYPQDEVAATLDSEYLWGDAFLVAPVMESGQSTRDVYLPQGIWIDYWTGQTHGGPGWVTVEAPLERLPLLVKAGSLVPMTPVVQSTQEYNLDTLVVAAWPDPAVTHTRTTIYHDDGHTAEAYALGLYEEIDVVMTAGPDRVTLNLERVYAGYAGAPAERRVYPELHRILERPDTVRLGGQILPWVASRDELRTAPFGVYWDAATLRLYAGFPWMGIEPLELVIRGQELLLAAEDRAALPDKFAVHGVYPNPFNHRTQLRFELPTRMAVRVRVFNTLGQLVATLADGTLEAGVQSIGWDGQGAASGIYLFRITAGSHRETVKVVLLR